MKKKFRLLISFLLICSIALTGAVYYAETIFTADGFSYTQLDGNYVSICGWDGGSDTMVIPEKLNESYVREIAGWSFVGREDFSFVTLDKADYLYQIGSMAFKDCTGISGALNIPAQVKSIGLGAFQGCISLNAVYYNTNADVPNQFCYQCSSLKEVVLADGVSSIGKLAFASCAEMEYIRIPDSVTSIDPTAFNNCHNIVIYCYTDSYAQQFAEDKGIEYVLIDAPLPTEPPTEAPTEAPTTQPTEPVTEEPTEPTSATEAPTEEPTLAPGSYILGDADGSGYVDIVDATFIQRIATNIDVPISREILMHADVDGDDDLTAIDATLIMRHLIRITTPYPIGEQVTT